MVAAAVRLAQGLYQMQSTLVVYMAALAAAAEHLLPLRLQAAQAESAS
jgi:hypothetical protein